ncbi:hypothetical protein AVEN_84490-1 [Araneus ventricosus]|uniref:Uncharacterized protein n=1 Tax=Araneus ventricosus TaxID=182803 RepID=A0A4Y2UBM4_ARAVE|nr:hypothetical protein AVEN_84490-1 [Araneus ventricosus]
MVILFIEEEIMVKASRNWLGEIQYQLDNRYIVPYNPFLLIYFQAYINVEICSCVKSVKYLHKYIYKGHDSCNVQITSEGGVLNHDEISAFLNEMYVSPTEAAFRMFSFHMYDQSHTVVRLPVHFPGSQQVYLQRRLKKRLY